MGELYQAKRLGHFAHKTQKNGQSRSMSLPQLGMPKAIQMKPMSLPHSDQALSAPDEDQETATAYRSWIRHLCGAED